MEEKYCYSINGEDFEGAFSSRDEAIAEGLECTENDFIFTGIIKPVEIKVADYIVDKLVENIYDEVGEVIGDWLKDVSPEAMADLDESVKAWLKKYNLEPKNFWGVEKIEQHDRMQGE